MITIKHIKTTNRGKDKQEVFLEVAPDKMVHFYVSNLPTSCSSCYISDLCTVLGTGRSYVMLYSVSRITNNELKKIGEWILDTKIPFNLTRSRVIFTDIYGGNLYRMGMLCKQFNKDKGYINFKTGRKVTMFWGYKSI